MIFWEHLLEPELFWLFHLLLLFIWLLSLLGHLLVLCPNCHIRNTCSCLDNGTGQCNDHP